MTRKEVFENRLTVTVPEAGRLLGVSRSLAFQLAHQGVIPTLRLGKRRLVVPVKALLAMLEGNGKARATSS